MVKHSLGKDAETKEQTERAGFTCIGGSKFHKKLQVIFYKLGYIIGKNPTLFILIPLFVTLICVTGVQQLQYRSDPEYLFSPVNGQAKLDRSRIETLFPLNFSENFDPSRNTRMAHFVRVLVSAKDNGTMLRLPHWNELNLVDQIIRNISITYQDVDLKYENICAKHRKKCAQNQILNLNDIIEEVVNGSININYPIMLYPYVFPFFYGGAVIDEEKGHLISTRAISLGYWTKQGGNLEQQRSKLWELKVVQTLLKSKFESIRISLFASRSLEDELERNAASVIPYFFGNSILMVSFSVLSIMAIDWVRSKCYLGVIAVMSSLFATATGCGLLMYLQAPFIGINMAIPFLLLGIGLDDQFVVLSAWHRSDQKRSVPERMAEAYSEAAASITITSLTTMLSSFIGTMAPFPCVYIFCLYTGVCVFFLYIWFVCFYGGCLAIAGYAEETQRHSVSCMKVLPKSQAEGMDSCYRTFCAGGLNRSDPYNKKDNSKQWLMLFFRDYVATFINKKPAKVFVLLVFLVYIAGALYGISVIEEGLDRRKMVLDDSYLHSFFNDEYSFFRKFPYRIQIAIDEEVKYSDPEVREKILNLHQRFENSTYMGVKLYTTSWIRHFYRWIDKKPELKANITDEVSFIKVLKKNYLKTRKNYELDIAFNENETAIIGSRFILQSTWVNDSEADKEMMIELREIAASSPFKTLSFHQFYVFFDQYLLIRTTSIQSVCLAGVVMMVIALIFIPSPISCCGIAFSIISIELGVIGYMSLWNVSLDALSMINLIMCIGFSVDFSAHISYAFLTADADTTEERVRVCMYSLGLPVIQGGLSTIIAVILLFLVKSYVYTVFFKIVFLVILFGMLHAIFLLPVLLSLLAPDDPIQFEKHLPTVEEGLRIEISSVSHLSPPLSLMRESKISEGDSSSLDKDLGFGSSISSQQESLCDETSLTKSDSDSDSLSAPSQLRKTNMGIQNESFLEDEVQVEHL